MELKYHIFDWDDNILHMDTKINMEMRISKNKWLLTEVSTTDFTTKRNNPNYRLPQLNGKDNYDLAYINFRDTGKFGNEIFLKDCKEALDSGDVGPSYLAFKKCLIEGRLLGIITARGHNPETLRKGVRYFIDSELNKNEKQIMLNNLTMYHNLFDNDIPEDLILDYLNNCDFIGVSSDFFINSVSKNEIPEGADFSPQNPELSKQIAVERFVNRCVDFSNKLGDKLTDIKIGFSDDDKGNIKIIAELFSDKLKEKFEQVKFFIYDTSKNDDGTKNYIKIVK